MYHLLTREQYWIKRLKTLSPLCLNLRIEIEGDDVDAEDGDGEDDESSTVSNVERCISYSVKVPRFTCLSCHSTGDISTK